MRRLDMLFSVGLALSACGHLAGSVIFYPAGSELQVWSLGSGLAGLMVAGANLMRLRHPTDGWLALAAGASALVWAGLCLAWGEAIGKVMDPRVLSHAGFAIGLAVFSGAGLVVRRRFE